MAISAPLARFRRAARMVIIQQRLTREMKRAKFELELDTTQHDEDDVFDPEGLMAVRRKSFKPSATRKLQFTSSGAFVRSESVATRLEAQELEAVQELEEDEEERREGAAHTVKGIDKGATKAQVKRVRQEKRIDAGDDILDTYHGSFLYGRVSPTLKMRAALRSGSFEFVYSLVEAVLAIAAVVIYVWGTYQESITGWPKTLMTVISFFFLADYLLKISISPVRHRYVFSFSGVIDLLSIAPAFFVIIQQSWGITVPVFIFLRIVKILPLVKRLSPFRDPVQQEIYYIAFSTLLYMFVCAGIYNWADRLDMSAAMKEDLGCEITGCVTFFASFYYMFVTMATIGYGDIYANSNLGRFFVILFIVAAITYIPYQVNRILELMFKQPYGGSLSKYNFAGTRYIVVFGASSLTSIREFLAAIFNPLHVEGVAAYPLKVVVMGPHPPSFKLKDLIDQYGNRVSFLQGNLRRPEDFERVSARSSSAFFLLANRHVKAPDAEDTAQAVRSLVAQRACGGNVRILVEMLQARSHGSASLWGAEAQNLEVVCTDPFRFKLLARSCFVKGLPPLITNLFRTGYTYNASKASDWMDEYLQGQAMEIFPLLFPAKLHNLLFEEAAELLFRSFGIILLALDTKLTDAYSREKSSKGQEEGGVDESAPAAGGSKKQLFIFPMGRVINPTDVGLVIGPSLKDVESISCARRDAWSLFGEVQEKWSEARSKVQAGFSEPLPQHAAQKGLSGREWSWEQSVSEERKMTRQLSHLLSTSDRQSTDVIEPLPETDADLDDDNAPPETLPLIRRAPSDALSGSSRKSRRGSKRGGSSEFKSVNEFLDWPPPPSFRGSVHPAVLERCRAKIERHLASRTLAGAVFEKAHILVTMQKDCWPKGFHRFVAALREEGLPSPPLVILRAERPSHMEWGSIGHFKDVFFIKGSPLYELDLVRAGILKSKKIIIMTDELLHDHRSGMWEEEETADEEEDFSDNFKDDVVNMIISANAERLVQDSWERQRVLCELQTERCFQYMQPTFNVARSRLVPLEYSRNSDALFRYTPAFCEGKTLCPAAMQFITYAQFFNRNVMPLLDQLLGGGPVNEETYLINPNAKLPTASEPPTYRLLHHRAVPKEAIGETFEKLFLILLERHQLAIGLFRAKGTLGAPAPYVFTNPGRDAVVHEDDFVYILA